MRRLIPAIATGLIAACACASAAAGDIYQWKDAKGVTHYGSVPPATGAYKVRTLNGTDPAPPVAAKSTEIPACAIARENLEALKGTAALQVDSDGDGKPDKTLSDADRANQLELAQATLKARCGATPAGDAKTAPN